MTHSIKLFYKIKGLSLRLLRFVRRVILEQYISYWLAMTNEELKQIADITHKAVDDGIAPVLDAINKFATNVEQRFTGIDDRFQGIEQRLDGMDKRFDGVEKRFDGIDRSINDLTESVAFIKDNAVTKQELAVQLSGLEHRLDQKIDGAEKRLDTKIDELINHVDGFAKKQETFDHELTSMKDRQDRFELHLGPSRA